MKLSATHQRSLLTTYPNRPFSLKYKFPFGSGSKSSSAKADINQQIAQLDERKVRLTFKDIWLDY